MEGELRCFVFVSYVVCTEERSGESVRRLLLVEFVVPLVGWKEGNAREKCISFEHGFEVEPSKLDSICLDWIHIITERLTSGRANAVSLDCPGH